MTTGLVITSMLLSWIAVVVAFWAIHKYRALQSARHFIDLFAMESEEILSDDHFPEEVKNSLSLAAAHITDSRLAKRLASEISKMDGADDPPTARAIAGLPDELQSKVFRAAWFFLMALSYAHADGWKLRRRLNTNPSEREAARPIAWMASHPDELAAA